MLSDDTRSVPEGCSDEINAGPAQRPLDKYQEYRSVITEAGHVRLQKEPYSAGNPAIVRSPLRHIEVTGRPSKSGDPLFTDAQHAAAEAYAALAERVAADGVKLQNLTGKVGGGSRDDTIECRIARRDRLDRLDALIGAELILDPSGRRAQPGRRRLTRLGLVEHVILAGATLTDVLAWARWQGDVHRYRKCLIQGLKAALDAIDGC